MTKRQHKQFKKDKARLAKKIRRAKKELKKAVRHNKKGKQRKAQTKITKLKHKKEILKRRQEDLSSNKQYTRQANLSRAHCRCCSKKCPLSKPKCGKGAGIVSKLMMGVVDLERYL